jgi:uncharacterized membrane protein (UPF0136 family)
MDAVVLVNLILCIFIVVLGVLEYTRTKSRVALYVGIAFGLFGISHLLTLLGLSGSLMAPLIIIRFLAYLTVIYALYINITKKKKKV